MNRMPNQRYARTYQPLGYTLLELMAALSAGLLVISSVYFITASSTRFFEKQQRNASTQMNARQLTDRLRSDIARAGFLGTPNSAEEKRCITSPTQIRGIEISHNDSGENGYGTDAIENALAHGVHADRLRLSGNYTTDDSYLISNVSSGGNSLILQPTWQGFRRSFVDKTGNFQAPVFDSVFRPGRWLHLETQDGYHFFVEVISAVAGTRSITVSPSLPTNGACAPQKGATLAPLDIIEYRVADPYEHNYLSGVRNWGGSRVAAETKGTRPAVLIRTEVDPGTMQPITATTEVVGNFIVSFDVNVFADSRTTPDAEIDGTTITFRSDAQAENTTALNPQRVRSVVFDIAVRSKFVDPAITQPPGFDAAGTRDINVPLMAYRPNGPERGYAAVRRIRSEVFMPNLAARNMQ